MSKTRAAVVRPGTNTFAWEDAYLDLLQADEVAVRMVACGICHTDLSTRDEKLPTPLPAVLGHEGAGVVEEVGAGVQGLSRGDTVLLSFSSCGYCPPCTHGHPAYCETFIPRNFGAGRPQGGTPVSDAAGTPITGRFFGQSAFSHRAIVDHRSIVRVEVANEDELAMLAPIGCGIQTGAGAILNELRPGPGSTVAVFGAGAVGLSAVMGAALTTATRVVAVDIVPARLRLARELGATHTINSAEEDPVARLTEIGDGRGITHGVEASGVPKVLRQAIDSLATSGTLVIVGAPPIGTDGTFDVNALLNGRAIRGVTEGDSDLQTFIPALVGLYRAGRLPFDRMVRFYEPDQINQAAADAASGEVLKPVLRFR